MEASRRALSISVTAVRFFFKSLCENVVEARNSARSLGVIRIAFAIRT
jgi:hypothetical protein